MPNFTEIEEALWTDRWIHGQTFETGFNRSTLSKSRHKNSNISGQLILNRQPSVTKQFCHTGKLCAYWSLQHCSWHANFTSIFAISHWQSQSPLTQGWRYRAACDKLQFYIVKITYILCA